ncbi:hypothetical protein [Duganella levis]|uniref:Uncharacterized protein n=1 Tax=Duganella levis TaxID=2692169 RepID=A0ABW9W6Y2_9BURK|nr:hypothetical protein [Duganella levis]MYN29736.1 hypothetical protein [Duganella levis]
MLHTLKNASLTGAFFLLLVLFVPAARADECLDRTWAGTIGDIPVTLEFSVEDQAHYQGRYHYRDNLADLYLEQDKESGLWREYDAKGTQTGQLALTCEDGNKLSGVWRTAAGDKPQPLVAVPGSSDSEQRIRNLKLQFSAPVAIGANTYRKVTAPGIKDFYSVTLQGDSAGIQALNKKLREYAVSNLSEIVECAAYGIMRNGPGNAWENTITTSVSVWNADLVVLNRSFDGECGGAHGNSWFGEEAYSTQTGGLEDMRGWFKDKSDWPIGRYYDEGPQARSLPALVWRAYGRMSDDCNELVSIDEVWPTAQGLVFRVSANAYANRNCEDQVPMAWKALTPFLSRLGIQRMKGLQGHK